MLKQLGLLAAAPLMGALFVIFLPVIGFALFGYALFEYVAKRLLTDTAFRDNSAERY